MLAYPSSVQTITRGLKRQEVPNGQYEYLVELESEVVGSPVMDEGKGDAGRVLSGSASEDLRDGKWSQAGVEPGLEGKERGVGRHRFQVAAAEQVVGGESA